MAYNRRNKLLQMQNVIAIYTKNKQPGISTEYVYRTFIYPVYRISRATLYNYLSTPVSKELKEYGCHTQASGFTGAQISLF